jgi:RNA polymerase sigma factor (sigma-70 family)
MKTQPAPASSVTWTDLLKKALAGDGDAENRLLEELRPFVKEIIEQRHGGAIPDDPSDVVQDCLVQIWKNLNQVRARDQAGFEAWVRRVAQNGLLDVVRKSQRQVRDVRRQKPLPADLGSTPLGGEQSTGSQNAIAAEEWERREQAFARLLPDEQQVLNLRWRERKEWPRVAEEMQRSVVAATRLYYRAIDRWQNEMGDDP